MTRLGPRSETTRKARLLQAVGEALYGHLYKRNLARGLGISRSTLHLWLAGAAPRRDVVSELSDLVERERDSLAERNLVLTGVRKILSDERTKQQKIANAGNH
ncbi:hypothetical protein Rpal_3798 [Rhodopseudomonas palustris TIE-1]|nr:hypothetical protein Rpal_3798 [Rhodopseudomonas palustris TIE-1]